MALSVNDLRAQLTSQQRADWDAANRASPDGNQFNTEVAGTAPGPSGPADPAAIIRQWQQSHSASEPLDGLIAELKRNGINADAFLYGTTPSGNEITLNGQKYKVKTGDNASWWDPSQGEAGGDWFAENLPAADPYTALARPDYLQGAFTAPTFTPPTMDDLLKDPGYLAGEQSIQRGLERSAAAKGSVLSGGFVGRTLPRALSEYAGNAYQNLFGQRYQAFTGNLNSAVNARGINEAAYQGDVGNAYNQYLQRYKTYRDVIGDSQFNAQLGLQATTASNPGGTGAG